MATRTITAGDLLRMPRDPRCELVRGEVRPVSPAGFRHGRIAQQLARILGNHVEARGLGLVLGPDVGFWIERGPDTVRAPDGAFLRAERLHGLGDTVGYFEGAPDLAIEVLSPTDRRRAVRDKCRTWVAAGSAMAVLFDPERRTAIVFTAGDETELGEGAVLEFGELIPGLSVPLRELFGTRTDHTEA